MAVSYTHLDVYKRQPTYSKTTKTTRPFKITSKNVSKNDLIVTSTFLLSRALFNMLTIFLASFQPIHSKNIPIISFIPSVVAQLTIFPKNFSKMCIRDR